MSQITPSSMLSNLEQDLKADWRHYHVLAHITQFCALFGAGLLTAGAAAGWHLTGWGMLASLVLGAAGTAVRQMWPQVPWSAVETALDEAKALADKSAPAATAAPKTE